MIIAIIYGFNVNNFVNLKIESICLIAVFQNFYTLLYNILADLNFFSDTVLNSIILIVLLILGHMIGRFFVK